MKWTDKRPTKRGWYFWKPRKNTNPSKYGVIDVADRNSSTMIRCGTCYGWSPDKGWWRRIRC